MRKIAQWFSGLAMIVLISSCKKNDTQPAPPVVPTDINLQAETKQPVFKANTVSINSNIDGFYSAVPANYDKTTKTYPLLISIHGGGQYGDGGLDLPLLLNDGIPQLLDEKIFPPNFMVNGKNYSFIVIAPQLKQFPSPQELKDVIEYAKHNYRVDTTRIYMSGLSNGGSASCLAAGYYPADIAAIVPVSGEFDYVPVCNNIATYKVAVWVFHNSNDPVDNIQDATIFISMINSFSPAVPPKLTVFNASVHDAWTKAIQPGYKENNMNIYEWMLQYSK